MKNRVVSALAVAPALAAASTLAPTQAAAAPTTGETSIAVLGSVAQFNKDETVSATIRFTCPAGMPHAHVEFSVQQDTGYSETAHAVRPSCTGKVQVVRVTSPAVVGTLVPGEPTRGTALIYFSCPTQESEACGGYLFQHSDLRLV